MRNPFGKSAAAVVSIVAVAFLSACSTHYVPKTPGTVAMVIDGGQIAYRKDGKVTKHGFLGSGLAEVVADDEEALEAAETYNSRMTQGFVGTLVGTSCLVASLIFATLAVSESDPSYGRKSRYGIWAAGTAACGLGGMIYGTVSMASGMPYHYDAINIYNDKALVKKRKSAREWLSQSAEPSTPAARKSESASGSRTPLESGSREVPLPPTETVDESSPGEQEF